MTDDQRRPAARRVEKRAEKQERLAVRLAWLGALCNAAIPVLAGLALLAGWSWWYPGSAFIALCTSKWLAHSYDSHRQHIIFEAEKMLKGIAPTDFSTEWVEAYTRRS